MARDARGQNSNMKAGGGAIEKLRTTTDKVKLMIAVQSKLPDNVCT